MPRLIDLSHPLKDGQPSFPGDPQLSISVHSTVAAGGTNLTRLALGSHQGTHLDVPFHIFDTGPTLDRVPLERFFGPARLIDLAPGGALAARTPIGPDWFEPHAEAFQPGARVLYRTGWDRTFGRAEFFTDYPTLTVAAAQWIAERRIGLLGMDTPTPGQEWRECHETLMREGVEIVLVEGLANLDRLPAAFTWIGFPLNFAGRDGSPIRAVALVDD
ncbi:MAG: cyclase family protein [Pirellulales bacterium]|nr:cyclase family protein [Pirellulales bacterium]